MIGGNTARLTDEAQVHKALARRLHHPPDLAIWGQLCADGVVQGVIEDFAPTALDDLVGDYRRFEAYERRKRELAEAPPRRPILAGSRAARFGPLEKIVAVEAAREEGVVSFRSQVLSDKLLTGDSEELEATWFLDHVRGSPRPSGWLHAPAYSIHGGRGVRPTLAETEAALRGYIAGEPQLAIGGRADYELDFLVCLVSCLMAWYGWPDSREVERFVLCGETPHVLFMTASFATSERFCGRLGRISVEVNQATSPAELLRFFKDVRRWLAEREGVPRRLRSCGKQAADLALHVARYNDGHRWQEMMSIWNHDHPEAAFIDARAFARRARDAYETLCNEPLTYRGNTEKRVSRCRKPPAGRPQIAPLRADEPPTT